MVTMLIPALSFISYEVVLNEDFSRYPQVYIKTDLMRITRAQISWPIYPQLDDEKVRLIISTIKTTYNKVITSEP